MFFYYIDLFHYMDQWLMKTVSIEKNYRLQLHKCWKCTHFVCALNNLWHLLCCRNHTRISNQAMWLPIHPPSPLIWYAICFTQYRYNFIPCCILPLLDYTCITSITTSYYCLFNTNYCFRQVIWFNILIYNVKYVYILCIQNVCIFFDELTKLHTLRWHERNKFSLELYSFIKPRVCEQIMNKMILILLKRYRS